MITFDLCRVLSLLICGVLLGFRNGMRMSFNWERFLRVVWLGLLNARALAINPSLTAAPSKLCCCCLVWLKMYLLFNRSYWNTDIEEGDGFEEEFRAKEVGMVVMGCREGKVWFIWDLEKCCETDKIQWVDWRIESREKLKVLLKIDINWIF